MSKRKRAADPLATEVRRAEARDCIERIRDALERFGARICDDPVERDRFRDHLYALYKSISKRDIGSLIDMLCKEWYEDNPPEPTPPSSKKQKKYSTPPAKRLPRLGI